jgi:hypothetical protein
MLHCPNGIWGVIAYDVLRVSRPNLTEVFRSDIEAELDLDDLRMIIA